MAISKNVHYRYMPVEGILNFGRGDIPVIIDTITQHYGDTTEYTCRGMSLDLISDRTLPIKQSYFNIKEVIFNNPATIVFWADGTKTVVKCQNDELFDPEKGLAMAITKRALGDKGNYFETVKKWVKKYDEKSLYPAVTINLGISDVGAATETAAASFRETVEVLQNAGCKPVRWKIYVIYHEEDGNPGAYLALPKDYSRKSNAVRAANRKFEGRTDVTWVVDTENPGLRKD